MKKTEKPKFTTIYIKIQHYNDTTTSGPAGHPVNSSEKFSKKTSDNITVQQVVEQLNETMVHQKDGYGSYDGTLKEKDSPIVIGFTNNKDGLQLEQKAIKYLKGSRDNTLTLIYVPRISNNATRLPENLTIRGCINIIKANNVYESNKSYSRLMVKELRRCLEFTSLRKPGCSLLETRVVMDRFPSLWKRVDTIISNYRENQEGWLATEVFRLRPPPNQKEARQHYIQEFERKDRMLKNMRNLRRRTQVYLANAVPFNNPLVLHQTINLFPDFTPTIIIYLSKIKPEPLSKLFYSWDLVRDICLLADGKEFRNHIKQAFLPKGLALLESKKDCEECLFLFPKLKSKIIKKVKQLDRSVRELELRPLETNARHVPQKLTIMDWAIFIRAHTIKRNCDFSNRVFRQLLKEINYSKINDELNSETLIQDLAYIARLFPQVREKELNTAAQRNKKLSHMIMNYILTEPKSQQESEQQAALSNLPILHEKFNDPAENIYFVGWHINFVLSQQPNKPSNRLTILMRFFPELREEIIAQLVYKKPTFKQRVLVKQKALVKDEPVALKNESSKEPVSKQKKKPKPSNILTTLEDQLTDEMKRFKNNPHVQKLATRVQRVVTNFQNSASALQQNLNQEQYHIQTCTYNSALTPENLSLFLCDWELVQALHDNYKEVPRHVGKILNALKIMRPEQRRGLLNSTQKIKDCIERFPDLKEKILDDLFILTSNTKAVEPKILPHIARLISSLSDAKYLMQTFSALGAHIYSAFARGYGLILNICNNKFANVELILDLFSKTNTQDKNHMDLKNNLMKIFSFQKIKILNGVKTSAELLQITKIILKLQDSNIIGQPLQDKINSELLQMENNSLLSILKIEFVMPGTLNKHGLEVSTHIFEKVINDATNSALLNTFNRLSVLYRIAIQHHRYTNKIITLLNEMSDIELAERINTLYDVAALRAIKPNNFTKKTVANKVSLIIEKTIGNLNSPSDTINILRQAGNELKHLPEVGDRIKTLLGIRDNNELKGDIIVNLENLNEMELVAEYFPSSRIHIIGLVELLPDDKLAETIHEPEDIIALKKLGIKTQEKDVTNEAIKTILDKQIRLINPSPSNALSFIARLGPSLKLLPKLKTKIKSILKTKDKGNNELALFLKNPRNQELINNTFDEESDKQFMDVVTKTLEKNGTSPKKKAEEVEGEEEEEEEEKNDGKTPKPPAPIVPM